MIAELLKCLLLVSIGVLIGHHVEMASVEMSTAKVELTDREKQSSAMLFRTFPTTFLVRIKAKKEFHSFRPPLTTDALAFTFVDNPLCEIWLPEGQEILFSPVNRSATWLNGDDADTIAHEILHCLRGAWHQAPVLEEEKTK